MVDDNQDIIPCRSLIGGRKQREKFENKTFIIIINQYLADFNFQFQAYLFKKWLLNGSSSLVID